MWLIDLDEVPELCESLSFFSHNRFNLYSFRDDDHLYLGCPTLRENVEAYLEQEGVQEKPSRITLLTNLRTFGHVFNPVSFYFCYDASNERVDTIVLEVRNTPWLETYPYVLELKNSEHPMADWRQYRFDKKFHVSPFMGMDVHYDWRFRVPGDRINVHVRNIQKGARLFDASLSLRREEINTASLGRVLRSYPPMTLKVTALIYWNALKLYLKGAPVFTHPAKRNPATKEV